MHPFIGAENRSGHNVKRACELLKVSRTAFYARRTGKPGPRAVRDAEPTGQIAAVHQQSRGTYGAPRIHAALQRKGVGCARRRVARLMRATGLQGRRRRRRHLTTIPDPRTVFRPDLALGTSPRSPRRSTLAGAATSPWLIVGFLPLWCASGAAAGAGVVAVPQCFTPDRTASHSLIHLRPS
ncbi:IS3 family transposase [Streptomyces sp. AM2-3-1]|uniref:IS3 family transposase n=1 Tax=Streptomyces sp. AM2-3-1 TaxID=3075824 RepID=UPI0039B6F1DC